MEEIYNMKRTFSKLMVATLLFQLIFSIFVLSPIIKAEPTKKNSAKKRIVAIDPGHQRRGNSALEPVGPGAKTKKAKVSSGTTGRYTRVPEYKLNLVVAKKLKLELEKRGYQVVMTRTKHDVNISNRERAILANKSGADISVRIHANGATSSSVNGSLALYPGPSNPYVSHLSKKSKRLSSKIISAMCKETGAKNMGSIVDNNLTGSNWSKIPVTVVEMGFMSNKKEDQLMQTEAYQNKMVKGMANGIDNYFRSARRS
jgi:N-acetylmuramoyl-L-alanine amidase